MKMKKLQIDIKCKHSQTECKKRENNTSHDRIE